MMQNIAILQNMTNSEDLQTYITTLKAKKLYFWHTEELYSK